MSVLQLPRMILDDLNKSRQLMLKNSGGPRTEPPRADPAVCTDQRSLAMVTGLESSNHPTTWVANNSTYNNPILPVFPRFEDDSKKEESSSNA
ncbi:hypothetical protein PMAYCL1PPCAC_04442 [Pristionchus mayeri]|uniref:Uncharacterized protein n=1 Tax=Pristionchus mayeri TaxID=1317129 RepID=A0AAN5C8X7_9BILA|nr:hypothetical protein PMAYCL1PPCAC_04442 [Pristionchus mayeri]